MLNEKTNCNETFMKHSFGMPYAAQDCVGAATLTSSGRSSLEKNWAAYWVTSSGLSLKMCLQTKPREPMVNTEMPDADVARKKTLQRTEGNTATMA